MTVEVLKSKIYSFICLFCFILTPLYVLMFTKIGNILFHISLNMLFTPFGLIFLFIMGWMITSCYLSDED